MDLLLFFYVFVGVYSISQSCNLQTLCPFNSFCNSNSYCMCNTGFVADCKVTARLLEE